jgi:hypothetical protein
MSNPTNSSKMMPDLNRIGRIVAAWQRHVVTPEEAHQWISRLLEPDYFMPKCELTPDPEPAVASRHVAAAVERLEAKLELLIRHHDLLLPDQIDPDILSDEVKKLADENRKIEAVSLHRARTGAQFARTVELVNEYIQQRKRNA